MRMVAPGAFMCVPEGKSIDFSDTTSIFARTVIEGLFGYRPQALAGFVELAPAMPEALPKLSGTPAVCTIKRTPAPAKAADKTLPKLPAECWRPLNIDDGLLHRVPDLFSKPYLSPRPESCSLQLPWSLIPPSWCIGAGGEDMSGDFGFTLMDEPLRSPVKDGVFEACGIPFRQSAEGNNVTFVSQWDNFPASATIPLHAPTGRIALLITGVTNAQLRFVHPDGSETCFDLSTPVSFRSIESGPENERPKDAITLHVEAVANEIVFGVMAVSVAGKGE